MFSKNSLGVIFIAILTIKVVLGYQRTLPLNWWQKAVIYQIYPRSFKDSNGDGVGDLKGIIEKVEYFNDLGVDAIWLSPIFQSPMADFGYDISDFKKVDPIFGTNEDVVLLKKALEPFDIKLMLDFVPNHSSDEHEWFKKSVEGIKPYTDYYVWKNPIGWNGSKPIPPNNWLSLFGGSAWEFNKKRQQFYLHQFAVKQPDLNYRSPGLMKEMLDVLRFWLDLGVDGFRVDAVPFLVEHPSFPDEHRLPDSNGNDASWIDFNHGQSTMDRPETYKVVQSFKGVLDEYTYKDNKVRCMVTEAYTTLEKTFEYYGVGPSRVADMSFNFALVSDLGITSKATDFERTIHDWMDNMPEQRWPNWVAGNHDNPRITERYGREISDGITMICLLLPGTAFTYNGEEIGMMDTFIRWDQTLDPPGLWAGPKKYKEFSRDPARTPFQWDSSVSSGFSTNPETWLPVNPSYYWLNVEEQKSCNNSHYNIYKRLVKLRSTPTIQIGSYSAKAISDWVLAITRRLEGHETYVVLVNFGYKEEPISLQKHIKDLPLKMKVHTPGSSSEHKIGDTLDTTYCGFKMRPRSSLVAVTNNHNVKNSQSQSAAWEELLSLYRKLLRLKNISVPQHNP